MDLFRALAARGARLTSLHLLEDTSTHDEVRFEGAERRVAPACPKLEGARVLVNATSFFNSVAADVWLWQMGGYEPAQKWLKDRRGRILTDEDIEHYKRIIGAITETIRIQKEIDEVIEAHGGWPAAFQGGESSS